MFSRVVSSFFSLILYLSFFLFYLKLFLLKELKYYINPNYYFLSWILFGFIIILLLLSFYMMLLAIFKNKKMKLNFKLSYLIFFIPLGLGFYLPAKNLSGKILERKMTNTNLSHEEIIKEFLEEKNAGREYGQNEEQEVSELANLDLAQENADGIIEIETHNFYRYVQSIYSPEKQVALLDRVFELKGLYFYDERYCYNNQAIIGRYLIVCCAADAAVSGFVAEFKKLPELKNNEWITIKGRLVPGNSKKDGEVPVFEVLEYEKSVPEADQYIYPDY